MFKPCAATTDWELGTQIKAAADSSTRLDITKS